MYWSIVHSCLLGLQLVMSDDLQVGVHTSFNTPAPAPGAAAPSAAPPSPTTQPKTPTSPTPAAKVPFLRFSCSNLVHFISYSLLVLLFHSYLILYRIPSESLLLTRIASRLLSSMPPPPLKASSLLWSCTMEASNSRVQIITCNKRCWPW